MQVFVTVHDNAGQLVSDLRKDEFLLWDGDQPRSIAELRSDEKWRLFLGVLIDVSGTRRDQWPGAEAEPAAAFVRRVFRPGDLGFVAAFRAETLPEQDATPDVERLVQAIRRAAATPPFGPSGLYDAIVQFCDWYWERVKGTRKALVIITDGEDNASRRPVSAAIEAALQSDTAIYIVCLPPHRSRSKRVVRKYLDAVEQLVQQTGGAVIPVPKLDDLLGALKQIELQIRGHYVLEFEPLPSTGKAGVREIKIETTRKGLKVLARKGYYAPKN